MANTQQFNNSTIQQFNDHAHGGEVEEGGEMGELLRDGCDFSGRRDGSAPFNSMTYCHLKT